MERSVQKRKPLRAITDARQLRAPIRRIVNNRPQGEATHPASPLQEREARFPSVPSNSASEEVSPMSLCSNGLIFKPIPQNLLLFFYQVPLLCFLNLSVRFAVACWPWMAILCCTSFPQSPILLVK